MKMRNSITLILASISVFAFVACSDAPREPHDQEKRPPNPQRPGTKFIEDLGFLKPMEIIQKIENPLGEEGNAAVDAKAKANSQNPIVYGVGAGGISLDTSFADSKKILTKPFRGPDLDGNTVYNESLYVVWRQQPPYTPHYILVLKDYLGKIKMKRDSLGGDIAMKTEFTDYKAEGEDGARRLAQDFYKAILDTDENCFDKKVCKVTWGADSTFFFIEYRGMLLMISRDRFSLFRVLIQKNIPLGPLGNRFDLFAGNYLLPAEQAIAEDGEELAKPIHLNQKFEEIEKDLIEFEPSLADVPVEIGANGFGRRYSGVFLSYEKTDFSRTSVKPKNTDKLNGITFFGEYNNVFEINGKVISVVQKGQGQVEIVDTAVPAFDEEGKVIRPADPGAPIVQPVQINMNLHSSNVLPFTTAFAEYLETKAKVAFPQAEVSRVVYGLNQKQKEGAKSRYSALVLVHNKATKEGLRFRFSTSEDNGNMTQFSVLQTKDEYNQFDSLVIPHRFSDTALEKKMGYTEYYSELDEKKENPLGKRLQKLDAYTELAGIKLNALVAISDVDADARSEATLELLEIVNRSANGALGTHLNVTAKGRVSYSYQDFIRVPAEPYDKERKEYVGVHSAVISSLGVKLGMQPIGVPVTANGVTRQYARVVSIAADTDMLGGSIKDLCGFTYFKPKMGTKDQDLIKGLLSAIDTENDKCMSSFEYDKTGNNVLRGVYFPQEQVIFNFYNNSLNRYLYELYGVTIYLNASQVKGIPKVLEHTQPQNPQAANNGGAQ